MRDLMLLSILLTEKYKIDFKWDTLPKQFNILNTDEKIDLIVKAFENNIKLEDHKIKKASKIIWCFFILWKW